MATPVKPTIEPTPTRGFNRILVDGLQLYTDLIVKIYNDFRVASLLCLISLLFLVYTVLQHVVNIPAAEVSVEFLGIIATLVSGVLVNIKLFLTERATDSEDRREHLQSLERANLRIAVSKQKLNIDVEHLFD